MSTLDSARRAASELLRQETSEDLPEWRAAYDDEAPESGSGVPNAITPVCSDEDHEPSDGGVYACCPEPVIPVPPPLVDYLVALLNADRNDGVR
ncbi:hypothetical protein [Streptomyces sp. NPDC050560]|uniref:hypothetical protein n=1 Tax=Streptomyces sp. NPDC050560 TaxID=3365630 RepID=UPI0037914A14